MGNSLHAKSEIAVDSQPPKQSVKEGWVFKKGAYKMAGWKKRYFQLNAKQQQIEYYTDESAVSKKGTIFLSNLTVDHIKRSSQTLDSKHHGFCVVTSSRTYQFCVVNSTDRDHWIQKIREIVEENQISVNCDNNFSKCSSAQNIKNALIEYHKISNNQNTKDEPELQKEKIDKIFNTNYSDDKLVNDFFHVKYSHSVHDEPQQFNLFYEYLSNHDVVLKCEIQHCEIARRHYGRRKHHDNYQNNFPKDLLSRIHTYFVHSFDTTHLTKHEIEFIENQWNEHESKENDDDTLNDAKVALIADTISKKKQTLASIIGSVNNSKYITANNNSLDFQKLLRILSENNFLITETQLLSAFEEFCYDENQLINDLLQIFRNETHENALTNILKKLNFMQNAKRKEVCDILLHQYIDIPTLNVNMFAKILSIYVLKSDPQTDYQQIESISVQNNLNGKLFIKGHPEFMNSIKFGKTFKTMDNWKKKFWSKIYSIINRQITSTVNGQQNKKAKPNDQNNNKQQQKNNDNCVNINYLTVGDEKDEDILQLFCVLTNASKQVAVPFLKEANWKIDVAIDVYYAFEGNVSLLDEPYLKEQKSDDIKSNDNNETKLVYVDGIKFWYWSSKQNNEFYIEKKHSNLKQEILNTDKFKTQDWVYLVEECKKLINVQQIKQIFSNGHDFQVYEIKENQPITLQHLYAIKLYTDYTNLCTTFCSTFRPKRFAKNVYERLQSLINRHKRFGNLAQLLTESVQCYGELIKTKKRYYRGLDMEFTFKKFVTQFHVPMSTTTNFHKATEFADGGLVVELSKYTAHVYCFDCGMISLFDEEREILFFGGNSLLQIKSIFQPYNGKWTSYRRYVNGIKGLVSIAHGAKSKHVKDIENMIKYLLSNSAADFALSPYITSLLKYHWKNLPPTIELDLTYLNDEEILKGIFFKPENILQVSNLCNLFKYSNHIICWIQASIIMTPLFYKPLVDDISQLQNTKIRFEFRWTSSHNSIDVVSKLRNYQTQIYAEKLQMVELTQTSFVISVDSKSHRYDINETESNKLQNLGLFKSSLLSETNAISDHFRSYMPQMMGTMGMNMNMQQMQMQQQQYKQMDPQSLQYQMYQQQLFFQQQFMQMIMTNPQQQAILMYMNPMQKK
eukprot:216988_1